MTNSMLHVAVILLAQCALVVSAHESGSFSTSFVVSAARDLQLAGGTQVMANPLNSIRSGNPGQLSSATLSVPLSAGVTLESISFSYRYITGFGAAGTGNGSNFTVRAAGSSVYASPHYNDYSYSANRSNYSSPVSVQASGLAIEVSKEDQRIEIDFANNDRNIQLLLPLQIDVTCSGGPCAEFELMPEFIDSNMVLQRAPARARIWGENAVPGETVSAVLNGVHVWNSTVSADGNWAVQMAPQEASTGHTLTVGFSVSKRRQVLSNVAFGDVYLCSGQSNMEFSLSTAFNATAEIADSGNYPGIRMFTAALTVADSAQTDVDDKTGGAGVYSNSSWAVSAPGAFSSAGFSWFSAVCYLFGRDLYKALDGKVPIGLVATDWGGQTIETFSSPDALSDTTCGGTVTQPSTALSTPSKPFTAPDPSVHSLQVTEESIERANIGNELGGTSPIYPQPSELWYAMIIPFAPMRFAGAVWYQGESNAGSPHRYSCTFPAMISDWRKKFELPEMSFFFVQLAAYSRQNYAPIRNAQMTALQLPKTGYAVAIDLGDRHSPVTSIHPRRKQEVGRRLALAALAVQYGMDVVSTGPVFASAVADPTQKFMTISFEQNTAVSLHKAPTADCDQVGTALCCDESPFEVLTTSNQWVRANYTIDMEVVVLFLPANASVPPAARYAWEAWPQCSLYNGEGGPDDHRGIASTPWCWDGKELCAA